MELSSFMHDSLLFILAGTIGILAYRFITKPLKRKDEIIPYGEDIPFLPTVPSSVAYVGSVKFSHEDNGAIICLAELEPKNGMCITCEVYLGFHMVTGFDLFPLCYKTGGEIKYVNYQCREILRNKMIQAYNDHVRENKQSSISDLVIPKQKPSPTATYGEYK